MNALKELRLQKKLTQKEVADAIGVSLRSYVSYENDEKKENSPKYRLFLHELSQMNRLDESHGLLDIDTIKEVCANVFERYSVDYCYLFGSYAKNNATEESDVDLLVSTTASGLQFYELTETLREELHKKVDLLDTKQLIDNEGLVNEVLKEGIIITRNYERWNKNLWITPKTTTIILIGFSLIFHLSRSTQTILNPRNLV